MLPFPNDYFSVPDPGMPTGRRISIPIGAFPAATGAAAFDASPWEHNDGFSPGSSLLTHVPGISLGASRIAGITDMGASLRADSPVVVVDTTTGRRWPTWSELDVNDPDPATQLLMVHPATNFSEGHHYVVALRDLRTSGGDLIPPSPAFGQVLGNEYHGPPCSVGCTPLPAAYASHLRSLVAMLGRSGVSSQGLFLAWDFTVDSAQNLTEPALVMRHEAFSALGSGVPAYRITKVVVDPPDLPSVAREVSGTFEVPSFLTGPEGSPGTVLHEGPGGLPARNGAADQRAPFSCEIPKAALRRPATVGIYGHGLFNSSDEVFQSAVPRFSDRYDYVFCGTDWVGLSASTLPLAATVVSNVSGFPSLVDNLIQSLLNAQFLGRLLDSPKGFARNAVFHGSNGAPLVSTGHGLVYYGNSEGGIMGGAFTALSTDARRSVLGVPGMDYDLLLPRSADFTPFLVPLDAAYPSKAVQMLGFDLIQMLWDRGEADGYAEQMIRGLPGTPAHQVMLEEGFGDHQVANVSTETEARTIGASVRVPTLAPGRSTEQRPFYGLPALAPGSGGPALTVWDAGVPAPPLTDTPPTAGNDPHDTTPRSLPAFWTQMDTFFGTGRVSDPCGRGPCRAPYPPKS